MDYIREYKSFINSHNLTGAVRITAGIIVPAILLGYFNNLSAGITVSIGAMCVGNTDNPGPIHHRRNGMFAGIVIIFIASILTGLVYGSPVLTGLLVLVFCFVFSMMSIYGNRASSIGVNALLVMVLNIDRPQHGWDILINSAYILAGGVWYTTLSLLLYSFRPYKLTQQALGDCVQTTAGYLRIKASFYSKQVDYDKSYRQLVEHQIGVHEKQDLVRELLFKGRDIVKESTNTGRILVMMFLDIVDLFERVMTSQQDYPSLHRFFDKTDLLEECRHLILDLAIELDEIGIAIKSGKPSVETTGLATRIKHLQESFIRFRDAQRTAGNVEGFIGMRHILDSIQDIADRLHTLHSYTTYDRKLGKDFRPQIDYDQFITHQDIDRKLLQENLTLSSNIFRHSLRVSIATFTGYLISQFFPLGHGYWILLTITVILKPAYSLTKKRNFERLMGTLAGAFIGLLILYFIPDRTVLFVLMIFFMIGTYVFLRTNYLICVSLMTPYVLLLFHLLYPYDFRTILSERVIDTVIGSAIAFVANIFLLPSREREQITDYMIGIIEANRGYFRDVSAAFLGRSVAVAQYKLSRKHAFVALANLSDAFNRILSEPGNKRKLADRMHQFVVSNHMLTSHIATLAYYTSSLPKGKTDLVYEPIISAMLMRLDKTAACLEQDAASGFGGRDETAGKEELGVGRIEETGKEELGVGGTELVTGREELGSGGVDEVMKRREALGSGRTDEPVTGKENLGVGGVDEPTTGKEELRILNEKMNALMDQRRAELEQGIIDSDTRRQLSGFKPIVDQFNFIAKVTADIEKLSQVLRPDALDATGGGR